MKLVHFWNCHIGSKMSAVKIEEASVDKLKIHLTATACLQEEDKACDLQIHYNTKRETELRRSRNLLSANHVKCVVSGKVLQGKLLRSISPESRVKLHCCYGVVIVVLTVAVVALSVALSVRNKIPVMENCEPCSATCPSGWIGFGSKCFYFSEDVGNWTFSQSSCMALDSHLALFDSLEELIFLKRYKGPSDHWIGLHRASTKHPWIWADDTEYSNLVLIRGGGQCGFLSDNGISSGRDYTHRKWICNKSSSYTSQYPLFVNPS
ncbi:C-type lectin domain family 2 member E isoform X3 [Rattus norvegicus]|uniref:C-type lectin domain family 2 member E isoform X3 n=1 Tax=Rattus norvegicus TaxID=10116 RepID=UPI002FD7A39D